MYVKYARYLVRLFRQANQVGLPGSGSEPGGTGLKNESVPERRHLASAENKENPGSS